MCVATCLITSQQFSCSRAAAAIAMALRGTTARAARSSGVQWDADVNEFAVADDAGPEVSAAVAAEEDASSVYSRTTIAGDSIVDYDSDGLDATADYDHPTGQPGIQASVRGTRGPERESAPREKTRSLRQIQTLRRKKDARSPSTSATFFGCVAITAATRSTLL